MNKINYPHSIVIIIVLCTLLTACGLATTRPKLEMGLAASAILAAKEANANILAPSLYRKAEFYYIKSKSSYRRKYFNKAKEYAELSRSFSEKAEYSAMRKSSFQEDGSGPTPGVAPQETQSE